MTVPLPETGDGTRRNRRAQRRRRARRRGRRALAVVVVAAVVAGGAWAAGRLMGGGEQSPEPADPAGEREAAEAPAPALVVLSDATGDPYGVTIFSAASSTIVHVPPGTMVEVSSLGLASLRDAAAEGGVELLRHSLENLLGVRFDRVTALDPPALAAAVAAVGSLEVDVDEPVEEVAASGRVTVVVPAGNQTIRPDAAVAFLTAVGRGTALDRLVRHQAFWSAYLGVAGARPPLAAAAGLAGEVHQRVLPVEAVSGVEGGEELFRVVEADLAELVERVFPGVPAARIRVRILNGAGAPGLAQRVQPLLVDAGGQVVLSGNADRFDYATTQVVYYDDADRAAAQAIRDAIGVGEIVKSLAELGVVDVTVVVGADFLAAHPGG